MQTKQTAAKKVDTMQMVRTYCGLAMNIQPDDVEAVLDNLRIGHAIMPMIDPTRYRDGLDNLNDTEEVLAAFLEFRKRIGKAYSDALEREAR